MGGNLVINKANAKDALGGGDNEPISAKHIIGPVSKEFSGGIDSITGHKPDQLRPLETTQDKITSGRSARGRK